MTDTKQNATYKLIFSNGSAITIKAESIKNAKRKICSRIGASRLGDLISASLVETKEQQKENVKRAISILQLGKYF